MAVIHKCDVCGMEEPLTNASGLPWRDVKSYYHEVNGRPENACEGCANALERILIEEQVRLKRRLALQIKALRWECSVERV